MSKRPLDYAPAEPLGTFDDTRDLRALRLRSEEVAANADDVTRRLDELAAAKRVGRPPQLTKKITIVVTEKQHRRLLARARGAGLTMAEVIGVALAPVLGEP